MNKQVEFFFVGKEMFWGNDRRMFVEEALTQLAP